jgi:hypothetical protein
MQQAHDETQTKISLASKLRQNALESSLEARKMIQEKTAALKQKKE